MKNSDIIDFSIMLKKFNIKHFSEEYLRNRYGLDKDSIRKSLKSNTLALSLIESGVASQYKNLHDVENKASEIFKYWYVENGDIETLNRLIYNRIFWDGKLI